MSNSYIEFIKAGGGIVVDTRVSSKSGKPMSCTLMTSNSFIIENAKKMQEEGVNRYVDVKDMDGFSIIRGLPYNDSYLSGREEVVVDGEKQTRNKWSDYPVSVRNVFSNHTLCICDSGSAQHLSSALAKEKKRPWRGKDGWESRFSPMILEEEIPGYKAVDAILRDPAEGKAPTILVGGAFFMDDKDYADFCDRLEKMGNTVVRESTGTAHTFEQYSRFMEENAEEFASGRDQGVADFNPLSEIVDKAEAALASIGNETPDMIVFPDKAKEIAQKEIVNGRQVLENERIYFKRTFAEKAKKPQIRSETYEYTDKATGEKAKGSIWNSPDIHNERLPSVDVILERGREAFADPALQRQDGLYAIDIINKRLSKSRAAVSPAQSEVAKTPKKEHSKADDFGM